MKRLVYMDDLHPVRLHCHSGQTIFIQKSTTASRKVTCNLSCKEKDDYHISTYAADFSEDKLIPDEQTKQNKSHKFLHAKD